MLLLRSVVSFDFAIPSVPSLLPPLPSPFLQQPLLLPPPNHHLHPLPFLHRRQRQQVQIRLVLVGVPPNVVLDAQNRPLQRPERRRVLRGVFPEGGAVRLFFLFV